MAFYVTTGTSAAAGELRNGLTNMRNGLSALKRARDQMNQMTDQQIVDVYGVQAVSGGNTAIQQAAALKAELASDIGKLETDSSQTNVAAALAQLFAQTG